MKKDVLQRNLERLIYSDFEGEKEPMEPMSEWKWNKLYKTARQYGIGGWVADGIRCYGDDFFLNMSPALRQKFLELPAEKVPERLDRFQLETDRRQSLRKRFSSYSLRVYLSDLVRTVKNIEE